MKRQLTSQEYHARKRVIRSAMALGKSVGYDGHKVYVDDILAYDPDLPPPAEDAAQEDKTKLWMYGEALKDLAREDKRYSSNANMWIRWDDARRLWWIEHAEYQAREGLRTIGAAVVARAVQIRLTRQMP